MVISYFGTKNSKSSWKYNELTMLAEHDAILALYCRVHEAEEIPNKEITLAFAKSLILMSKGKRVNWAQFLRKQKKARENLKEKVNYRKEKKIREAKDGLQSGPPILGK